MLQWTTCRHWVALVGPTPLGKLKAKRTQPNSGNKSVHTTGEMSRKLGLTQKQIIAICKGASKAGYMPIIEVNGMSVKLVPASNATPPSKTVDKPIAIRF